MEPEGLSTPNVASGLQLPANPSLSVFTPSRLKCEASPFSRYCIDYLSPLQANRNNSPFPRTISPLVWTEGAGMALPRRTHKRRVIKKLDFSEATAGYEFKADSILVQIRLSTEEKHEIDLPKFRPRRKIVFSSGKKNTCNCQKSKCLKLYCECFAANDFCSDCNCKNCMNRPECEGLRKEALNSTLEKNPNAFQAKVKRELRDSLTRTSHSRGCNCKKSACQKRYCECFQSGSHCSEKCRCDGCKNV